MNLNNSPTLHEFRLLFLQCDDSHDHLLWVDKDGNVHMDKIKDDRTVGKKPGMHFRWEPFEGGHGYVGPGAVIDATYMQAWFNILLQDWNSGKTGVLHP